eukprot:1415021-Lingulodinium_polyedra.AAC.1
MNRAPRLQPPNAARRTCCINRALRVRTRADAQTRARCWLRIGRARVRKCVRKFPRVVTRARACARAPARATTSAR